MRLFWILVNWPLLTWPELFIQVYREKNLSTLESPFSAISHLVKYTKAWAYCRCVYNESKLILTGPTFPEHIKIAVHLCVGVWLGKGTFFFMIRFIWLINKIMNFLRHGGGFWLFLCSLASSFHFSLSLVIWFYVEQLSSRLGNCTDLSIYLIFDLHMYSFFYKHILKFLKYTLIIRFTLSYRLMLPYHPWNRQCLVWSILFLFVHFSVVARMCRTHVGYPLCISYQRWQCNLLSLVYDVHELKMTENFEFT